MKFTKIDQDGKIGRVNGDNVLLVLPSTLVGQTQLLLVGGLAVNVKGTVDEISDALEGGLGIVH